jgi:hypothetical protein
VHAERARRTAITNPEGRRPESHRDHRVLNQQRQRCAALLLSPSACILRRPAREALLAVCTAPIGPLRSTPATVAAQANRQKPAIAAYPLSPLKGAMVGTVGYRPEAARRPAGMDPTNTVLSSSNFLQT